VQLPYLGKLLNVKITNLAHHKLLTRTLQRITTNVQNEPPFTSGLRAGRKKQFIQHSRLLRTRSTFSKSVMVSVAVSKMGVTELMFVDPGVKVNGHYYRNVLLSQQMIPAIKQVAGDTSVFQQDSSPAHRARDTFQLLQRETPDFTGPDLWPPSSPDPNPVDSKIWGANAAAGV